MIVTRPCVAGLSEALMKAAPSVVSLAALTAYAVSPSAHDAQRRSQYRPMLETISAIRVQANGLLSICLTRDSHFRQKIFDFRQAEAKR